MILVLILILSMFLLGTYKFSTLSSVPNLYYAYYFFFCSLVGLSVYYFYGPLDKIQSMNEGLNEAKRLQLLARSFLSTNSIMSTGPNPKMVGTTSPSARIFDTATRTALEAQVRYENYIDVPPYVVPGPLTGIDPVYESNSSTNVTNYSNAKKLFNIHVKKQFKQNSSLYLDVSQQWQVREVAHSTNQKLSNLSLGSCDQSDCGLCIFSCSVGDCGVCDTCGCSDMFCCPSAPPGFPMRCGFDGQAECIAVSVFQNICGDPGLFATICDVSGAIAPEVELICTLITGMGVPIACAAGSNGLKLLIANQMGCTC